MPVATIVFKSWLYRDPCFLKVYIILIWIYTFDLNIQSLRIVTWWICSVKLLVTDVQFVSLIFQFADESKFIPRTPLHPLHSSHWYSWVASQDLLKINLMSERKRWHFKQRNICKKCKCASGDSPTINLMNERKR